MSLLSSGTFRRRSLSADTVGLVSPKKTKSNPLGAGRNPRAGEPAKPFTFNLTTAERSRYQAAADADSKTLGEWIRAACEAQLSRASRSKRRA